MATDMSGAISVTVTAYKKPEWFTRLRGRAVLFADRNIPSTVP